MRLAANDPHFHAAAPDPADAPSPADVPVPEVPTPTAPPIGDERNQEAPVKLPGDGKPPERVVSRG